MANLRWGNLTDAHLRGADLSGADLSEAVVTSEQLATAKSLENAIMPDTAAQPAQNPEEEQTNNNQEQGSQNDGQQVVDAPLPEEEQAT